MLVVVVVIGWAERERTCPVEEILLWVMQSTP